MTKTIDNAGEVVNLESLSSHAGQVSNTEVEPDAILTVEKRGKFLVAVAPPGTPPVDPKAVDDFINDLREGRIR